MLDAARCLPAVGALEMMRFAGFRAFSLLQADALNLLASALVAHLHFLKSGADVFGRTWSVICLWLASHLISFLVAECSEAETPTAPPEEAGGARA